MSKKKNDSRCLILARVSSKEQAEGYSLPAQEKLLKEYASREGLTWEDKHVFVISEKASKTEQRDIFHQMMESATKDKIKVLVVEKVDRLVRNLKDTVMIDDWLEADEERKVHFVKDGLILHKNSRSQEKLNWNIRVVIAKNYIDNLREEVDKGIKEKLAEGWLPGTPPPGYLNAGKEGQRIQLVNKKVAPLVQKMFDLYLEPAQSLSTLTKEMAERGLTSKNGRSLSRTHIRHLLGNRYYIGELWWDGKYYGTGKHVAIIKGVVFESVQRKLNNKNIPKYRTHNPLFRGLLTCDECGSLITWEQHKGMWYGRCKDYRKQCSRKKYLKQEEVEQRLFERFEELLAPSPDIAEWTKEAIRLRHENDMGAYYATMNHLKHRHTDLARRIDLAYDDRADGRITAEKYDQKVTQWEAEQAAILEQLAEFDDTYHARLAHNLNVLELSQRAGEIYKAKESVDDRRALLGELFSNLTINGPSLSVEYSEVVGFIAEKAEKSRALKNNFEQGNNGPVKPNGLHGETIKDIWLGR